MFEGMPQGRGIWLGPVAQFDVTQAIPCKCIDFVVLIPSGCPPSPPCCLLIDATLRVYDTSHTIIASSKLSVFVPKLYMPDSIFHKCYPDGTISLRAPYPSKHDVSLRSHKLS